MNAAERPVGGLNQRVIDLLCRQIGVAETLRFLSQFNLGTDDYTKEREALIGHLTLEEILAEAREVEAAQDTKVFAPHDEPHLASGQSCETLRSAQRWEL